MINQRALVAVVAVFAIAALSWFLRTGTPPRSSAQQSSQLNGRSADSIHSNLPAAREAVSASLVPEISRLADDLNRPSGTIAADLQIIANLLEAFRSNFPHTGNPVGENKEITAALAGANSLGLAIIPPAHTAINARGELCDRWTTPFFFHQLSGSAMEIRSAGPDRVFQTGDDHMFDP